MNMRKNELMDEYMTSMEANEYNDNMDGHARPPPSIGVP